MAAARSHSRILRPFTVFFWIAVFLASFFYAAAPAQAAILDLPTGTDSVTTVRTKTNANVTAINTELIGKLSSTSLAYAVSSGLTFSTTSTAYWASTVTLTGFSTTSAAYFASVGLSFASTSADYFASTGRGFSSTSAAYFSSQGLSFSSTSANNFVNASTTIPKTYTANTFTAAQTFNGGITVSSCTGCSTASFPFTPTTNYGALSNATNTPVWFQSGLQASSTSRFANIDISAYGALSQGGTVVFNASSTTGNLTVGPGAGAALASGSLYNTLVGYNAGALITTGTSNTIVGSWPTASVMNLTTGTGNILFGTGISLPSATANNQLNIGNLLYGRNLDGTGFSYSSGTFGVGSTTANGRTRVAIQLNNGDTNNIAFAIGSSTANSTTTLFSIDNRGNVAMLGSTTVASQLNAVNGAVFGPATFISATSSALAVTGSTTVSGQFNATAGATFGNASTTGNVSFGSGTQQIEVRQNNASTNTAYPYLRVDSSGNFALEPGSGGDLYLNFDHGATRNTNIGGNLITTIGASATVGIGTSTPGFGKLSIGGNVVIGSATAGGTNGTLRLLGLLSQSCLGTDSTGVVIAGTCSSSAFPFTSTTYGGVTANATSTPLGLLAGFYSTAASSTITGGLSLLSATSSLTFALPTSVTAAVVQAGQIAFDTTDDQLVAADGSGTAVFSRYRNLSAGMPTSTPWTGTTTQNQTVAPFSGTLKDVQCKSPTGTLNVQVFVNSTKVLPMFNGSSTVGNVSFSGSNTFSRGDIIEFDFGTPASSPTLINCTMRATENQT